MVVRVSCKFIDHSEQEFSTYSYENNFSANYMRSLKLHLNLPSQLYKLI
jgi:hypothetical protein